MILSPGHGFAFIHIPKCAGSNIREQLERFDETKGEFWGVKLHPELGRIDYAHLPLDVLRAHFPETFEILRGVETFAVTRDPLPRFRSSFAEHVKIYRKTRLADLSEDEIGRLLDETMQALERLGDGPPPAEYSHFTPQWRYAELDGQRFVDRLVPLERIGDLFAALSDKTGVRFSATARANRGDLSFRLPAIERSVRRGYTRLKGALPYRVHDALRRAGQRILTRQERPSHVDAFFRADEVTAFVARYYARDRELHAATLARAA
jgi:hypothetical protein